MLIQRFDHYVTLLRCIFLVFSHYFQLDVLYFLNSAAATVYHARSVNDGVAEWLREDINLLLAATENINNLWNI